MILYQHDDGYYLAVPPRWCFRPGAGYCICFDGQDVPDIICAGFIRESGGYALHEAEVIELNDEPASRWRANA